MVNGPATAVNARFLETIDIFREGFGNMFQASLPGTLTKAFSYMAHALAALSGKDAQSKTLAQFVSTRGGGKSFLTKTFQNVFGQSYVRIIELSALTLTNTERNAADKVKNFLISLSMNMTRLAISNELPLGHDGLCAPINGELLKG